MSCFSYYKPIRLILSYFRIDAGTMCLTPSATPGTLGTDSRDPESEQLAVRFDFAKLHSSFEIERLFQEYHLNPKKGISDSAYHQASEALDVDVTIIEAVSETELGIRGSFDEKGRPTILFEPHIFRKHTKDKYDSTNPYVSNTSWGGGLFAEQYKKLKEAYALDPIAALESASWGGFQIMGFNFLLAGFRSVQEMVLQMMSSEEAHLSAFVAFITADKNLHLALKNKDWADFARRYNGPGYEKNRYHIKMKDSYDRLKATSVKEANR